MGHTKHVRFIPVKHEFTYPVAYLGVDLDSTTSTNVWSILGIPVIQLRPSDFLGCAGPSLVDVKKEVLKFLASKGVHGISRVHLVTMPRFFGYAFNPVNFYFCYRDADKFAALFLEVHNTFGESHFYVVSGNNETVPLQKGFDIVSMVKRSFHVSPFNDISGNYVISAAEPVSRNQLNVHIAYETDDLQKKFYAYAQAKHYPLHIYSVAYLFLDYPVTLFLTFPRILWEAGKLAYARNLGIYPKPTPSSADTIVHLKPSLLESMCTDKIVEFLDTQLRSLELTVKVAFPLSYKQKSQVLGKKDCNEIITVTLYDYDLFFWLFFYANTKEALAVTSGNKSWSTNNSQRFQAVILKCFETVYPSEISDIPAYIAFTRYFVAKQLFHQRKGDFTLNSLDSFMIAHLSTNQLVSFYLRSLVEIVMLLVHYNLFDRITPWVEKSRPSPWDQLARLNSQ